MTNPIVLVENAAYTESPRWHDGALWFSDIGAGEVRRIRADGPAEVYLDAVTAPSGLGWTAGGELLVVSIMDDTIYRVDANGHHHVFCGPADFPTSSPNDMATVGERSYVTCTGRHHHKGDDESALAAPVGAIVLLEHANARATIVAEGLKMPNGIAVSRSGKTLFVAEVFAQRVLRFDMADDGTVSNMQVHVQLDHTLDGLAIDAEDGIWVGGTSTEKFFRFDAQGRLTDTFEVPGWSCIASAVGGQDGREMFMCVSQDVDADSIFEGRSRSRVVKGRVRVAAQAQDRPARPSGR